MRRTSPYLLMLALVMSACSDSSTEPPLTYEPSQLRLQIVSGDGQSAPVASGETGASQVAIPAHILVQAAAEGVELLPEPLVVRLVEAETGARVAGNSVPTTMLAGWHVEIPECGRPFLPTTSFEDGESMNYWVKGTLADYDCDLAVSRIVDGEPVIDSIFRTRFEPGPAVKIDFINASPGRVVWLGDTLALGQLASAFDEHGNRIPRDSIHWSHDGDIYIPEVEAWDTLTAYVGEIERKLPIAAMRKIGPGWQYEWHCGAGVVAGEAVDSLVVTVTVDSVRISLEPNWPDAVAELRIYGPYHRTYWYSDHDPVVSLVPVIPALILTQRPGAIDAGPNGVLAAVGNPPTHWEAKDTTFCQGPAGLPGKRHALRPPAD